MIEQRREFMVHHGNAKDRCSRILLHNSKCDEKNKAGETLPRHECLCAVDTDCHIEI